MDARVESAVIAMDTDDMALSHASISTVLDSIDALIYVADMDTHELIYLNKFGREQWGDPQGKTCFKLLQEGQEEPCGFCSNHKLLDDNGESTGVYIWEFQNTVNQRWYQCRDQAIRWIDGRMVRMEIAVDITERKVMEAELKAAKEAAEQLAEIDPLTQCFNRRAFFSRAEQYFSLAQRHQTSLSLVVMDLDLFKQINDQYGHSGGDIALTATARLLCNTIRLTDICARFGGEEFVILLPETDEQEAIQLVERLRTKLENLKIPVEGDNIKVTASFGLCSFTQHNSLDSMISSADKALYQAKHQGCNCLVLAEQ